MHKPSNTIVTVVGSGIMGNGIAHSFAQHHFSVFLCDSNPASLEKGMNTIASNLERQIIKGSISVSEKETILKRITPITDLQKNLAASALIIEAVPEVPEIKREVFRQLDQYSSRNAILASNTSSISITELASYTSRPEQVIGMHFMNPVPVMKLVEIICGKQTSTHTKETIVQLTEAIQKIPVLTNDSPGFISNRILMPMINEAIFSFYEGVAEVEAIDTIMKLGMAHPMGPLQLADYIGLDTCLNIMQVLQSGFQDAKYTPCPLLVEMVAAGQLGAKSKRGFYDWSNPKQLKVNTWLKDYQKRNQ